MSNTLYLVTLIIGALSVLYLMFRKRKTSEAAKEHPEKIVKPVKSLFSRKPAKPIPSHNNRKETQGRAVRKQLIYANPAAGGSISRIAWLSRIPIKVIYHYNT